MPRRRKHHRLNTYRAAMFISPTRRIHRHVVGSSFFDAAQRMAHAHLNDAVVFPGRYEGSYDGARTYSFGIEGFGQRLWIMEGR